MARIAYVTRAVFNALLNGQAVLAAAVPHTVWICIAGYVLPGRAYTMSWGAAPVA